MAQHDAWKELEEKLAEARQTAAEAEAKLAQAERVAAEVNSRLAEVEQEYFAAVNWAASHVIALPEMWALIAEHSGLVGAWRQTEVCLAARVGAKDWLRTLRRLVVCGGYVTGEGFTSAVWSLDLRELRWDRTSHLGSPRGDHACCEVRGGVVVLGGEGLAAGEEEVLSTVEALRWSDSEAGGIHLHISSATGMRSPLLPHRTPHRRERERRGSGASARRS